MILDNLNLFLRIVERGGMAAAGRDLGLSPATVSERVAGLEAHFGTRLLNRTTRSISLTEEGRELVQGAQRLLAEAEELDARIRLGVERLAGPIKISAPIDLGRNRIARVLDRFVEHHPEITVDLHLNDGYVDLAGQGFDLAVRYGNLPSSSLHARRLAESPRFICASPAYLEKNGTPATPEDLLSHNCILMRFGENVDRMWHFLTNGEPLSIPVRGNRIANDGDLVRTWCVMGHGIARKSRCDIEADLAGGRLVALLDDYQTPPLDLQAVFTEGRTQTRRVRVLVDFLVAEFCN